MTPRTFTGYALLAACLVLAIVEAAYVYEPLWQWLGVFDLKPCFADAIAILAAGQAKVAGLDPYAFPNPFDPWGRPHTYGPGWLVTGSLGLTTRDAGWIGAMVAVGFVLVGVAVLAPRNRRDLLVTVLLLASPQALLAINRANNDVCVLLFLAGAAWLLTQGGRLGTAAASAMLILTASLKLYPIAALPLLAFSAGRRRDLLARGAVVLAACALIGWVWRSDYEGAMRYVAKPNTIFSYGVHLIPFLLPYAGLTYFLSLLVGVVVAVFALKRHVAALGRTLPMTGFSAACYAAGAGAWLFCFVAVNSFGYRLVLLVLLAQLWIQHLRSEDVELRQAARTQIILWLVALWLAVPKDRLAYVSATHPEERSLTQPGVLLIAGFEQGLVLALTVAVGVTLAGGLWRRWQDAQTPVQAASGTAAAVR